MATERDLIIDCQFAADLPPAYIDPRRFTQVMSDLTTNAITFTPAGGTITLSTAVQSRDGREWVTFTARDTGHGIPAPELPHISNDSFAAWQAARLTPPAPDWAWPSAKTLSSEWGATLQSKAR